MGGGGSRVNGFELKVLDSCNKSLWFCEDDTP